MNSVNMNKDSKFIDNMSSIYGRFFTVKRVIAKKKTKYQELELIDTPAYGKMMILDGKPQIAEYGDYFYHEPLAQLPMFCAKDPKRVLIIGGGDGGSPREVLKHNVKQVDMVELDEDVIKFAKEYLRFVCKDSYEDKRLNLHIGDGRAFVEAQLKKGEKYDVIISDLTDPFGPSKMLYTKEFYTMVKKLLNKGGVFSTHCEFPLMFKDAFPTVTTTLNSVFPHAVFSYVFVPAYGDLMVFGSFSAEKIDEVAVRSNVLKKQKSLDLKMLGTMAMGFPRFLEPLMKYGKVSTDADPYEIDESQTGVQY
ncbi:MAG: fused MFS/spermidine synthase [Candidatus Micrarchaeota archaeon]